MTPESIDALPDFTDANLLKLYRYALANGWAGTSRQIDGQAVTFPEPGKLLDLIERLEARASAEDGDEDGDGVVLAKFS